MPLIILHSPQGYFTVPLKDNLNFSESFSLNLLWWIFCKFFGWILSDSLWEIFWEFIGVAIYKSLRRIFLNSPRIARRKTLWILRTFFLFFPLEDFFMDSLEGFLQNPLAGIFEFWSVKIKRQQRCFLKLTVLWRLLVVAIIEVKRKHVAVIECLL